MSDASTQDPSVSCDASECDSVRDTGEEPVVECAEHLHRRRRRDGLLVAKSPLFYHIYKRARRSLKRAGLLCGLADDRPKFDRSLALDFCQVRHYQTTYCLRQLHGHGLLSQAAVNGCCYEIDELLHHVLKDPEAARGVDFGNAWQWAAMIAQQHTLMERGDGLVFDRYEEARRWTLEELHEVMTRPPHASGPFCTSQKMAVDTEAFHTRTADERWRVAKFFERLLEAAAPDATFNAVRRASRGKWLHERIAEAKPPQYRSKGAFGSVQIVEV
jgi:hypothetical protein